MYCHSKDYAFRYSDADFQDIVRPASFLAVMQESACLSADELGFGYKILQPKNIGFILSNWYVDLLRPVKYDDVLTVHTWPVKPKHMIVMRDFELFANEQKIGVGTSRWCLVDLTSFTLLPTSVIFSAMNIDYNDFRSTPFNSWKIPRVSSGNAVYKKMISYSDYDHYNHVNNTKYADLLMDAFSVEELRGKWAKQFRVSYIKQCKYGEKLLFYRDKLDNDVWIVEGRVDDELRVQFYVEFDRL